MTEKPVSSDATSGAGDVVEAVVSTAATVAELEAGANGVSRSAMTRGISSMAWSLSEVPATAGADGKSVSRLGNKAQAAA